MLICGQNIIITLYTGHYNTVEKKKFLDYIFFFFIMPLNNGHSGDKPLVHCREVVPISESTGGIYMCVCYNRLGASSMSVLRRLFASQSVHYLRFHCNDVHTHTHTHNHTMFAEQRNC